jgi:hypothetical protein
MAKPSTSQPKPRVYHREFDSWECTCIRCGGTFIVTTTYLESFLFPSQLCETCQKRPRRTLSR